MEILQETKECVLFTRKGVPFAMQVPGGRFFIATMQGHTCTPSGRDANRILIARRPAYNRPQFLIDERKEGSPHSVGPLFDQEQFLGKKNFDLVRLKHLQQTESVRYLTILTKDFDSENYFINTFTDSRVEISDLHEEQCSNCSCREIKFTVVSTGKNHEMRISSHEIFDPTSGMNFACNLVRMALINHLNLPDLYEFNAPYLDGIMLGDQVFAVFDDCHIFLGPNLKCEPVLQISEGGDLAVVGDKIMRCDREFSVAIPDNLLFEKICYRFGCLVVACSFGGRIYFDRKPVITRTVFTGSGCEITRDQYLNSAKEHLINSIPKRSNEESIEIDRVEEVNDLIWKKPTLRCGIQVCLFFAGDKTIYFPDEDKEFVGVRMIGKKRKYVRPTPEFVLCSISREGFSELFPADICLNVIMCIFESLFDGTLREARDRRTDLGKAVLETFNLTTTRSF
jgi:hypothetical protein